MDNIAKALGIESRHLEAPLLNNLPGGVAVFRGSDRSLVYASKSYHDYTGYSREECDNHGSNLLDVLIHPEDAEKAKAAGAEQTGKERIETEYRIIKKNGTISWVRCCATLLESPVHGGCILCTFFDITKERGEALATRQEIDLLMNTIPGGVAKVVLKNGYHVLLASEGFYRLTGYTKEEYHQPPIDGWGERLVLEEDLPHVTQAVEEQAAKGNAIYVEYRIRKKNGGIAWIAAHATKIGEADGAPVLEGVFIDTTITKNTERQLLGLTNSIPGGVAHLNIAGRALIVNYASDGFFRLLGTERENFMNAPLGADLMRCVYSEDREVLLDDLHMRLEAGKRKHSLDYRILRDDGQIRWCRMDGVTMENDTEKFVFLECVITDITEAKHAQQMLEMNEARYRLIFEHTQDIVFDWDMKTNEVYHSSSFEKKFGYVVPSQNTMEFLLQNAVPEEDHDALRGLVEQIYSGRDYVEAEYRLRKRNGKYIWCRTKGAVVFDKNHNPVRAVGIVSDVDHYMRKTERLRVQARMDLLTGLLNKVTAQRDIEEFLNEDGKDASHAFFLIDIDNFKSINDNFGHMMGDTVLTEISERIRSQFRAQDIVGRMGGDEFAVLLANTTDREIVMERARQLCGVFHNLFEDWKTSYRISGSIGVAIYPEDGTTFQELYEHADIALYDAKKKGKDQCAAYQKKEAVGIGRSFEKTDK